MRICIDVREVDQFEVRENNGFSVVQLGDPLDIDGELKLWVDDDKYETTAALFEAIATKLRALVKSPPVLVVVDDPDDLSPDGRRHGGGETR